MNTKAVRIHGKMDLRLDEVQLPEVGPDDVRVRVVSDSLCMSSYKAAVEGADHKRVPDDVAENPTIVGHEFCGDDGGPYAVDAPQEGQEENGGHLEDQGPQEGDQGRGETVAQGSEEAGNKNGIAHKEKRKGKIMLNRIAIFAAEYFYFNFTYFDSCKVNCAAAI